MMVCIYCGRPCEFWCRLCGEAHLVTEHEYAEANGEEAEE